MTVAWMNSGTLWGAGLLQTALADAEVHLFKAGAGITISRTLVIATLEAAECDYTGYAAQTIAAWMNPVLMPYGGSGVNSGALQFAIASPYTVTNVVGGGWVQDAAGVLLFAWDYDPTIPLIGAGNAVPVEQIPVFGG